MRAQTTQRGLTIDCEVHPAAVVEGIVLLLQHQDPTLIPALVLRAHWVNLQGGLPMQRGSTWRRIKNNTWINHHNTDMVIVFFCLSNHGHALVGICIYIYTQSHAEELGGGSLWLLATKIHHGSWGLRASILGSLWPPTIFPWSMKPIYGTLICHFILKIYHRS